MENTQKDTRRFVSLPLTREEYEALTALVVDLTAANRVPFTRAGVIRDGLNRIAQEVQGKSIFQGQQ